LLSLIRIQIQTSKGTFNEFDLHAYGVGGDNWVIGLLILASVVSIGVMIERWLVFRKNRATCPPCWTA